MKKSQHNVAYRTLILELKKARLAAGLTQAEVAGQIGKHAPFINKIESGERRVDVIELAELCRIYKTKLSNLIKKIDLD